MAANNSGQSTLTADSCAGCHRAHTAQAAYLLAVDEEDLCLSCHGTNGMGAVTNVEDGVQYATQNDGTFGGDTGPIIGALRSGGFVNARIDSGDPYRAAAAAGSMTLNVSVKVSVLDAGQPVTSAHLNTTENGLTAPTVAWGNGAPNSGAGPTVTLECTSCHNVHGNGQYRILNPIPDPEGITTAAAPASVTDYLVAGAVPATTRNYTVVQTDAAGNRIYLASDVVAVGDPTAGDYWHRRVPWNVAGAPYDAPNGLPNSTTGFPIQISTWCSTCHTRYLNLGESGAENTGDAIFMYQHATSGSRACTTCHVAHGSNAAMDGEGGTAFSADFPYPGSTEAAPVTSGSSRLLKIDNRGTCQACHNPTGVAVPASGTVPNPLLP